METRIIKKSCSTFNEYTKKQEYYDEYGLEYKTSFLGYSFWKKFRSFGESTEYRKTPEEILEYFKYYKFKDKKVIYKYADIIIDETEKEIL
jgi:hypothetical protein